MTAPAAPPDVTVVTVTYNAAELVSSCLDSLREQDLGDLRLEVVVVDNDSSDGTAELVAERHPWVRLVRAGGNLGFAAGNNLVLEGATSRYVVLLNNDAVADPGFVRSLVTAMDEASPRVAAMAARVLLAQRFRPARAPEEPGGRGTADGAVVVGPDGTFVADPAGAVRLVNSTGNLVRTDGFGVDRGWLCDAATHHPGPAVFGFSGAAGILRTAALSHVGGFDPRHFMYYEDTDLSWRLRLAGYDIAYCEGAVVHHEHSATAGEGSELVRFHDARNRLLTVTKNGTPSLVARVVGRYVLTTASIALRRSQPLPLVATRVRAFGSYLALLPHALRQRRRTTRLAQRSRHEVERGLVAPDGVAPGGYRTAAR